MTSRYYIADNQGRIVSHAGFKFQDGCLETTEKIVLGNDGFYYIEGEESPKPEPTLFEKISEA